METNQYEREHMEKVRKIAPECMVLLKSDGSFPLKRAEKIALYGNAARHTLKGGTGSGDVNVKAFATIEDGLKRAGFEVSTNFWLDAYDRERDAAEKRFKAEARQKVEEGGLPVLFRMMGEAMPEPEYEIPMTGQGETAVYVLGRVSGEGTDRKAVPGDFLLSDVEMRDILYMVAHYPKCMLVLNTGGPVDLGAVADKVPNILLLSQPGMAVGDAFADVLSGAAYPSGKLAATWAAWEDYCIEDFGKEDDTRYREGIYVGYRYFDSVGKKVLFPFGYGLGYTSFEIRGTDVCFESGKVKVSVKILNNGKHRGKEVAQLYVSIPEGRLDQPYQVLAAFGKTGELEAGEAQNLELSFELESLATYDMESSCRVLEKGEYLLRIGNSSKGTELIGIIELQETAVLEQLAHVGGTPDFKDWRPGNAERVVVESKEDWKENIKKICLSVQDLQVKTENQNIVCSAMEEEASRFARTLTDSELMYLCTGQFMDEGSQSIVGNSEMTVAGAAGETTNRLQEKGVPNLIMADGPAGLRLSREYGMDEEGIYSVGGGGLEKLLELVPDAMKTFLLPSENRERKGKIYEQNCTAIPVGTALAQSWSTEVCEICGDLVGSEMERFHVHLWLAPALNIQRSPLCGRNFEYFSEDPLLSGKLAAAITESVQKHTGCGVTVKHFVCNNQETNRFYSNSMVSERALRDIYMKGFELAVRQSQPKAVMSSYNLLNGEHTSQRTDILETVLRKEWGFRGIVMSDWLVELPVSSEQMHKYGKANAPESVAAGNDLMMPGSRGHYEDMRQAIQQTRGINPLKREHLERAAARITTLVWELIGK